MPNVNVRISDEQNTKLKKVIEDIEKQMPEGGEVSNSTVVRKAIDNFINERDRVKLTFDLNSLSEDELKALYRLVVKMYEVIPKAIWEGTPEAIVCDLMESKFINLMKSISNLQIEKGYLNKNGTLK